MEVKRPLTSIEQWYEYAINLDRHVVAAIRHKV